MEHGKKDPMDVMRRYSLLLFVILTAWMVGDHPMSAQDRQGDPCPVKYRKDPIAAGRAREAKKQRMRENRVPERYLHLLDKMECVACIETAPDTLHITVLYNDDAHAPTLSTGERDLKVEFRWNPQSERQLRDELRNGQIRAFYVWIHEKRCNCCPDLGKKAESYADWDDDIGANMDETEQYDDPDDLGPLPDDLKPPPPGSQTPPPPVERFDDLPRPARRVLQATCKPCEGLAEQWTNESNNLNFLWDRKLERMRQISVVTNIIANRRNEIATLEYEQRFDSTRTYDNLQKIRNLKKLNEDHESQVEEYERDLADIEPKILETEIRMEELMQKFLECEKSCKTTLTAAAPSSTPTANAGTTQTTTATATYGNDADRNDDGNSGDAGFHRECSLDRNTARVAAEYDRRVHHSTTAGHEYGDNFANDVPRLSRDGSQPEFRWLEHERDRKCRRGSSDKDLPGMPISRRFRQ